MEPLLTKASKLILGTNYSVSFAFITDTKMKELNKKYRGLNKTTDILSFPLDKENGEIVISKTAAAKKAKEFGMKKADFLNYILIHGLLHLKGMAHGSKMSSKERECCTTLGLQVPNFLLHEQKNHSRNRHRNTLRTSNHRNRRGE